MFTEGIIKTYNEEKGFGFIQIEDQKKDLFFHIKDFPNKQQLPQIGEKLKFRKPFVNQKSSFFNISDGYINFPWEP
ncbi:MAG: hypothetical protein DI550_23575 [Escherichia coli]|nr:MAG: hypothetical protein DI550_23575 [Escherichia coli]